jgi:hypothetical protein
LLATRLSKILDVISSEILYAQARYQESTLAYTTTAPDFYFEDSVWLDAQTITMSQPSMKLDHKRLRAFTIQQVISGSVYDLELPETTKCHPGYCQTL